MVVTSGSLPMRGNPFLSRVALMVRAGRPLLPAHPLVTLQSEVVGGRPFVRLWFITMGCSHDRQGHCTMCNYGRGHTAAPAAVEGAVSEAIRSLATTGGTLLMSPSGSMFDDREVAPDLRRALWALARDSAFDRVLTESRAELVNERVVREARSILAGKELAIEIGLESSDPWILRHCVNKGLELDTVDRAIERSRELDVPLTVNVSLGTAFLTPAEAVDDAVATVRWALDAGATDAVVFPLLVRRWTVLGHLFEHGRHEQTSLWALVEVLMRLGPAAASRVSIAWYRNYDAQLTDQPSHPLSVVAAPTTCPRCETVVLRGLDDYRDSGEFATILQLDAHSCPCHDEWRRRVESPAEAPLRDRVRTDYAALAKEVLGETWWRQHGVEVLAAL